MLDLTISIVTYKTDLDQVKKAVSSCLDNKLTKHIVVADNDSGDEYFLKLKKLENDAVTIISTGRNNGYGYGHNYSEQHCGPSRCHLIMNSDIEFVSGTLDKLYQHYKEKNKPAIIAPKIVNSDGSFQFQNKRRPALLDILLRRTPSFITKLVPYFRKRLELYEMRDMDISLPSKIEIASGCFMFCDRELLNEVDGFDEQYFMYFEDFDLCNRLAKLGEILYYPEATVVHHWERGSKGSYKLFYALVRSAYIYFNKWGWRLL